MIIGQERTIGFMIAGGASLTVINMTTDKDFMFAFTMLAGISFVLAMFTFVNILENRLQKSRKVQK